MDDLIDRYHILVDSGQQIALDLEELTEQHKNLHEQYPGIITMINYEAATKSESEVVEIFNTLLKLDEAVKDVIVQREIKHIEGNLILAALKQVTDELKKG